MGTVEIFRKNWTQAFWDVPYFSEGVYWKYNGTYEKDKSDVFVVAFLALKSQLVDVLMDKSTADHHLL